MKVNCITLFDKSKSYTIYDVWNITTVGRLELKFKTQSQYCLLLYVDGHDDQNKVNKTLQNERHVRTEGHFLQVALINGELEITQQIISRKQRHKKSINIGSELNDLQWHTFKITKFVGTLQVEIDRQMKILSFSKNIGDKFKIKSRLYVGGLSKAKIERSYGTAKFMPRYVIDFISNSNLFQCKLRKPISAVLTHRDF